MKSAVELGLIAGIAALGGLGNWLVGGRPSGDPAEEVQKIPLKEGEIRLETALEEADDGLVWIDARPAALWQKERKTDSINITMLSDEALADQLARHADLLFGSKRVIVYCDDVHCSVSHDLSMQLKGEFRDFVAGEVLVLHGGMTVLRAAGLVTSSSP
ncbi:rhodanese-like domain-containing protein [Haloferula chungangensis]|uniref:Rhodanese-like domain-containing protein n=1 Tax=Haloferula chungangensis TaxID=1048331 RepID=A0ABW2LBE7_9BACT